MSKRDVVETFYGKYCKYEVMRTSGTLLSSPSFSIYRDGELYKAGYSSLSVAVDAARKLADR